jgi:hypothetical protein
MAHQLLAWDAQGQKLLPCDSIDTVTGSFDFEVRTPAFYPLMAVEGIQAIDNLGIQCIARKKREEER